MEGDTINDLSFVVMTGPPQKDKNKRLSQVRSVIRKSRLRRDGHLQAPARSVTRNKSQTVHTYGLGDPRRALPWDVDLSWLTVSEMVQKRLRHYFRQYIESNANLHPFFRTMITMTVFHPPLMSTKLVSATAWDELNGPNPGISALTLSQRGIAENMLQDSLVEATSPDAKSINIQVALISLLSLLSFEIINGDQIKYLRQKTNINRLLEVRGGIDALDNNFKIGLLLIYQLEPVIKGFANSVTPSVEGIIGNETLMMSQPTDFKLLTFGQGQTEFWEGAFNLSTIRLCSDFYQLVMLSIQYQQLLKYHQTHDNEEGLQHRLFQIRTQWHFLRDNYIALHSISLHVGSDPPLDQILFYAISLFISPTHATHHSVLQECVTKLHSLLRKSDLLQSLHHGPLPGALIWCLIVGARRSDEGFSSPSPSPSSRRHQSDAHATSVSTIRKWFIMQLLRVASPAALDDPINVSRNIDMILAGMDGADSLCAESYNPSMNALSNR